MFGCEGDLEEVVGIKSGVAGSAEVEVLGV